MPRTKRLLIQTCAVVLALACASLGDDWPQWRGPRGDGVWRERGITDVLPTPSIPHKWSVPISSGYSGPTVADGRVYVTDRVEEPVSIERVHCFDAATGEPIWDYTYDCEYRLTGGYDAGPRASVTVHGGKAYALGAMGHFHCFDAATGRVDWAFDLKAMYDIQMPLWGLAASPVIEGDLVIVMVGGAEACLVAFDKQTGRERWRALNDRANYATPIVIEQAGRRVMVAWTGDRIVGLDPTDGTALWAVDHKPRNMPLGIASPVVQGDLLFFSGFYDGAMLLRLSQERHAAETVWKARGTSERRTEAVHSLMSTPIVAGSHIYGIDSHGELRCLDLLTGERVWEDTSVVIGDRWANVHMVRHEPSGHIWMFNEQGELLIAELSPRGLVTLSRSHLIAPTTRQLERAGRGVAWAHPAFADGHVFVRNDKQLICADLSGR